MPTRRVAIVGGGITGATAASTIAMRCGADVEICVFDQGRRGPGGRASHRSVQPKDGIVLPDDGSVDPANYEFDHGCQFFRADTARMRELAARWCAAGWAAPWQGRFGLVGGSSGGDFFGLPSQEPVYVGVGGMHKLPRAILRASETVTVHAGVRVSGMTRRDGDDNAQGAPAWVLEGVGGVAAFHDTPEVQAAAVEPRELGKFDLVLLTDVSSSFESWHRASAGVPEAIAAQVRNRVRVPLFSCMVVLPTPLALPYDALTFGATEDDGACTVWFAARSASKPGLDVASHGHECWTLVSTPAFAVAEISRVTMQDESTGAFRPQEDSYLNAEPGPVLYAAFVRAITPLLPVGAPPPPAAPLYLQGQRWGSAFPAPAGVEGRDDKGQGPTSRDVLGVNYESAVPPLVYERPSGAPSDAKDDFLADDALGLIYAGDYCSRRPPGFEAACLSGLEAGEYIAGLLHPLVR